MMHPTTTKTVRTMTTADLITIQFKKKHFFGNILSPFYQYWMLSTCSYTLKPIFPYIAKISKFPFSNLSARYSLQPSGKKFSTTLFYYYYHNCVFFISNVVSLYIPILLLESNKKHHWLDLHKFSISRN